jgi:hypothetical protein
LLAPEFPVILEKQRATYLGGTAVRVTLLGSLAFALASAPVFAHHGFAGEFDRNSPVALSGVVTKVEFMNPHIYFYVDVKDKDGKVEKWTFESFPPGVLYRKGLRQDRLKPGGEVTLKGFQARDGSNFANVSVASFPDGKSFCVQFPGASAPVGDNAYDGCTGGDTGEYR